MHASRRMCVNTIGCGDVVAVCVCHDKNQQCTDGVQSNRTTSRGRCAVATWSSKPCLRCRSGLSHGWGGGTQGGRGRSERGFAILSQPCRGLMHRIGCDKAVWSSPRSICCCWAASNGVGKGAWRGSWGDAGGLRGFGTIRAFLCRCCEGMIEGGCQLLCTTE